MKLTNSIRHAIRDALIERKQANKRKGFVIDEDVVAQRAYNRMFNEFARSQINCLPSGWLPVTSVIWVSVKMILTSDGNENEYADDVRYEIKFVIPRPVPESERYPVLEVDQNDSLAKEVIDISERRDALAREKHNLREKIDAALAPYQTKKQLLEGWPEIRNVAERFLHERARVSGNFIIPVKAELNVELELP